MKKYLLIVSIAALGLSFTACGGQKKQAEEAATTEEVKCCANEAACKEGDVFVKYECIVNKLIGLQEGVLAGDADAIQESANLTEEMTAIAAKIQENLSELTPEQTQKLTEIAQKWADAAQQLIAQP